MLNLMPSKSSTNKLFRNQINKDKIMKILFSVLLMIVFTLTVTAQSKTTEELQKQNESFKKHKCKITYDKFKDVTSVVSSMSPLRGTAVTGLFSFTGQILKEQVKTFYVSFTTISLMEDASLIFIANNERVNIGKPVEANKRTKYMGIADIYLHLYEFTPEQLEKFVSTEKVEFQIGTQEFSTNKDTAEKLKNLLTLSKLK